MRIATFIILTFSVAQTFGCECIGVNRTNFKDVLREADFAFIGTPLKNVFILESELEYLDARGEGADILVKVDSVLKGNFKSDTVFVNQESEGNCLKMFKLGGQYLIIGFEIKEYRNILTPITMLNDSIPAPPPPVTFENGVVTDRSSTTDYVDFHNRLLEKYTTLTTNQCLSFSSKTQTFDELLSR